MVECGYDPPIVQKLRPNQNICHKGTKTQGIYLLLFLGGFVPLWQKK